MKYILSLLLFCFFILTQKVAIADEGMWLPLLVERLNYTDMQQKGLQLTPDEIYSVNHSSMKDAIVSLNNGSCSASVISKEGLVLTNYHCLYDAIQTHTTTQNDMIANGFWAKNRMGELRSDNLTASFLVRIEDVTARITASINPRLSEVQKAAKLEELTKKIITEATKGNGYTAQIKDFMGGREYYMFVYETFADVRIVGVPASTIGKFGGDTDNWMWPRYTADFALCRIYTGPDGKPATYNKKNIPMVAKYHLPVSTKGVQQGDFSFTMGYPAKTNRFISSFGVKYATEMVNPIIIRARGKKLEVIKQEMQNRKEISTMYASKYSEMSNFHKYYVEQNKMLKQGKVLQKKVDEEEQFMKWVLADPQRKAKYEKAFRGLEAAFDVMKQTTDFNIYYREAIKYGAELPLFAMEFGKLIDILKSGAEETVVNTEKQRLNYEANKYFKDYDPQTDKKIFMAEVQLFFDNVPAEQYPEILLSYQKKFKGNVELMANEIYEKSIFPYREKVFSQLSAPNAKALEKDPAYLFIKSFNEKLAQISVRYDSSRASLHINGNLLIEGYMNCFKDKKYYTDANATMRLAYGTVVPSNNMGAGKWQTTLDEMMQLATSKNPDYAIMPKLKEVYEKKDFGSYTVGSSVPVCFLTDCDVAGGNSGSPVINGKGELVGLCFDLTKEATSSALLYDSQQHRAVNTDIRFILFVIDKVATAPHITSELTLTN